MKKLITTTLVILGLALPATASACATATVTWEGTTPYAVDRVEAEGIRYDFVGTFVQWTTTEEEVLSMTNYELDLASEAIPSNAESVEVCADGVTFDLGEPVEREPTEGQLIEDIDAPTWRQFYSANVYPI